MLWSENLTFLLSVCRMGDIYNSNPGIYGSFGGFPGMYGSIPQAPTIQTGYQSKSSVPFPPFRCSCVHYFLSFSKFHSRAGAQSCIQCIRCFVRDCAETAGVTGKDWLLRGGQTSVRCPTSCSCCEIGWQHLLFLSDVIAAVDRYTFQLRVAQKVYGFALPRRAF